MSLQVLLYSNPHRQNLQLYTDLHTSDMQSLDIGLARLEKAGNAIGESFQISIFRRGNEVGSNMSTINVE
jgi:hypothetical protein